MTFGQIGSRTQSSRATQALLDYMRDRGWVRAGVAIRNIQQRARCSPDARPMLPPRRRNMSASTAAKVARGNGDYGTHPGKGVGP
jgi:hypothetical protein